MNVLRDIFNFYINSSIHVALSVCAFTAITFEIFQAEANLNLICFIFFGTVTGYNFVKYAGIAQLHHRSLTTALQTIQYFSLLCFFCCIYFTFKVGWNVLLGCLPLGLLTLFYAVPLFSSQNLRTAPTIKIFVIAAVWAGATVY
ncbi:MAG: hypothetical protein WA951_02660, partial [Leeuwenhoekiella sp.]